MLANVDVIVLVTYLVAIVGLGIWFGRRSTTSDAYMAASHSLPGWAIGLSMFGSYISSISFLANPGKAYAENWNAFVFSIATPIAAAIAVRWFVPFYRHTGYISAYTHLERRFGLWARTYAVFCFLLYQTARMGTVIYLLALAVAPLIGWSLPTTIIVVTALMTFYTMIGGIKAVVWTGVLQSLVLVGGTVLCIATVVQKTPGGLTEIIQTGVAQNKFSFGSFGASLAAPTFWVIFLFGLFTHLTNFGVDQSYIQRYITARNDREAVRSVWLTTWMYVPVAAIFFFIGTSLFAFYGARPELLGAGFKADDVFPHFIATQLPTGMAGLVVAGIFASSMDANFNSMATLTLCDIYQRYFRPTAGERESMLVLRIATFGWGLLSACVALALISVGTALDAWWELAGMFSGGVLGLFLLGLICKRADNTAGAIAVTTGVVAIVWMSLPSLINLPMYVRNPMHANLTIVVGTLTIFLVGVIATKLRVSTAASGAPGETTLSE